MLIGYIRASLEDKSLDAQRDQMNRIGCTEIYVDMCYASEQARPGLAKALETARSGDAIVVSKLDRVGQSTSHIVGLLLHLSGRGIGFKSLAEDIDTTGRDSAITLRTVTALAQLERDLAQERSTSDLSVARARGQWMRRGRPRTISKQKILAAIEMLAEQKLEGKDVAAQLGMSLSTLYSYVDSEGRPRERAKRLLAPAPAIIR